MTSSRLFRLDFAAVHFGDDGLDASTVTCAADTLFSALCIQALRAAGYQLLDELVAAVTSGSLRFTDLLPYADDVLFAPKPILRVAGDSGADASAAKKAAKRLTFVPVGELDGFLAGRADLDRLALLQERIGVHGLAGRAAIHNGKDDAEPYRVGFFRFEPTAGLWCLAQGSGSELDLFAGLLENLSALGGERSSGYGGFSFTVTDGVPPELQTVADSNRPLDAQRWLALTTALPTDPELETALAGATYRLIRRSGFVASATYADSPLRKRDIYKFAAGSLFAHRFDGVVADVGNGVAHPVHSYAKPLFLPLPEVA